MDARMAARDEGWRHRFADTLRLADGTVLTVRFVEAGDGPALQAYVRSLSSQTRSDRFLGGISELSPRDFESLLHSGEGERFALLVEGNIEGAAIVVAEARYMRHGTDGGGGGVEFGLSVHDRWQRRGIGAALLANLECRAAALGAVTLFGDTRRGNVAMQALARKAGFRAARQPADWTQIRFVKEIDLHAAAPCAGATAYRLATLSVQR
jgi:GNAT superfamily N-acetyltransferase